MDHDDLLWKAAKKVLKCKNNKYRSLSMGKIVLLNLSAETEASYSVDPLVFEPPLHDHIPLAHAISAMNRIGA